jgi:hypothetical protein
MRGFAALLIAAGVLGVACYPAAAQAPGAFSSPRFGPQVTPFNPAPVSPYLNLVRGNNPALGLYLGTYPELDRQRFQNSTNQAFQGLDAFLGQPQQPLDFGGIPTLPQTGHLSSFQSYGFYYNSPFQQRPYYPLNPSQARLLPR